MGAEPPQLHVALLPFMARGHMIPALDIARLFSARNVRATIITTPVNAPAFETAAPLVDTEVFRFPAREAGLPEGCENLERTTGPDSFVRFTKACEMLREQLEEYLGKTRPDCLVADMFFPWATDAAAKFDVPRLVFHGVSFFSLSAGEMVRVHQPHRSVSSDEDEFAIPCLPHQVKLTRLQVSEDLRGQEESEIKRIMKRVKESERECYGVVVNSFYELEPDYADFYRERLGRRAWHIGPVSLCDGGGGERQRPSDDEHGCLRWLDSKEPSSVVYVCFGSTGRLIAPQLRELALALEASGLGFVWVVREGPEGLQPGFEERVRGRGLVVRGWAPQVLILEHRAVAAFVTHCGWNSTLEGISAGVPLVTWPIAAEQFYNERLAVQVLRVGVPVGAKKWSLVPCEDYVVKRDAIEKALREVTAGEEAGERRERARRLKEMAREAVREGGSSYNDLGSLIDELSSYHAA